MASSNTYRQRSFLNGSLNNKVMTDRRSDSLMTDFERNLDSKPGTLFIKVKEGDHYIDETKKASKYVRRDDITKQSFFDTFFFDDGNFCSFATAFLHQKGLPYVTQRSVILHLLNEHSLLPTENGLESQSTLYIDKKTKTLTIEEVVTIKNLKDGSKNNKGELYDTDKPRLTVSNRIIVRAVKGQWKYRHTDTEFCYHDESMKPYFDKRRICTLIKDFIKKLFHKNTLKTREQAQQEVKAADLEEQLFEKRSPFPSGGFLRL